MFIEVGGAYVGSFWHPARPDERMPGLLRVGETGDPSLQLFGWVPEALDGVAPARLPALLGEVRGQAVSLWDCSLSEYEGDPRPRENSAQPSQVFEGHQLLVAKRHFPKPDEVCFTSVSLKITHLGEWAAGMIERRDQRAHYEVVARVRGARITAWGRTLPVADRESFGHKTQHRALLTSRRAAGCRCTICGSGGSAHSSATSPKLSGTRYTFSASTQPALARSSAWRYSRAAGCRGTSRPGSRPGRSS